MRLKNKIALITGASSGIGKQTAIRMAQEGATVIIASRREAENQATVAEITNNGGKASYHIADISKETEVKMLIDTIVHTYGRLDCAYNNAGTIGAFTPLVTQSETDFDTTFAVNAKGVFLCMKYQAQAMMEQKKGTIVNCSSWLAQGSLIGSSVYSASKSAVEGLTRTAALEWASHGIRVNAIAPGGVDTKMTRQGLGSEEVVTAFGKTHPVGRLGTPEEIANLVCWLSSDEASFVTGERISIDGGYSIIGQRG